jgi:hypothetical protein
MLGCKPYVKTFCQSGKNMAPSQIPLNVNVKIWLPPRFHWMSTFKTWKLCETGMGFLASLGADIDLIIIATDQTKTIQLWRKRIQKQTKKKNSTITSNQEAMIKWCVQTSQNRANIYPKGWQELTKCPVMHWNSHKEVYWRWIDTMNWNTMTQSSDF